MVSFSVDNHSIDNYSLRVSLLGAGAGAGGPGMTSDNARGIFSSHRNQRRTRILLL
jgi:hypothetical protein